MNRKIDIAIYCSEALQIHKELYPGGSEVKVFEHFRRNNVKFLIIGRNILALNRQFPLLRCSVEAGNAGGKNSDMLMWYCQAEYHARQAVKGLRTTPGNDFIGIKSHYINRIKK